MTDPLPKPYPEYKTPSADWFGRVPEHWTIRTLGSLCRPKSVTNRSDLELLSVYLNLGVVRFSDVDERRTNPTSEDLSNYQQVDPGDFVLNNQQAWRGSIGVSKYRGIVSPAYLVLAMSADLNPYFANLLFREQSMVCQYLVCSKGVGSIQRNLYWPYLKRAVSLVPPLAEQTAIVRYLDHTDSRIQSYISAKERLIELLTEQKRALINQAVTRGLDPSVPLKPSGVDWLGDVPAHWAVAALKHRYSQCLGKMLDSKSITGNNSLPYLRNVDVQWDRINVEALPTMDISPDEYSRYTVQQGDLLVCEGGEVGRSAIWSGDLAICGFQKALHRLRPINIERDIPRFMYYSLRAAAIGNAFNDGQLSTIMHLTGEKLRAHRFPFPPVSEQNGIIAYLDRTLAETDTAIDRAHRQIKLINEYRTRLIADVVTGKLDVRGVVADESEMLTP